MTQSHRVASDVATTPLINHHSLNTPSAADQAGNCNNVSSDSLAEQRLPSFQELCSSLDLPPSGPPRLSLDIRQTRTPSGEPQTNRLEETDGHGHIKGHGNEWRYDPDATTVPEADLSLIVVGDEVPSLPRQIGWFKPSESIFFRYLQDELAGLTRNELYGVHFQRDAKNRPVYGEDHKATRATQNPRDESHLGDNNGPRRPHAEKEQDRRLRHRGAQVCADERCPDLVYQLSKGKACDELKHELEKIGRTKRDADTKAKGVGKDQQLLSVVFAQELSAYVLHSEHEGRVKAENLCHSQAIEITKLKAELQLTQRCSSPVYIGHADTASPQRCSSLLDYEKVSDGYTASAIDTELTPRQLSTKNSDHSTYVSASPTKRRRTAELVLDLHPPHLLPLSTYLFHGPPQQPPSPTPSGESWQVVHHDINQTV